MLKIEESANEDQQKTWSDAVSYCRTMGADLVSIHSADEEKEIVKLVSQNSVLSYVYFWIGLNNINTGAGYQWSDSE